MTQVRVFMSCDLGHDHDLKERLIGESLKSFSGFEIVGCSEPAQIKDLWKERVRRLICDAGEAIFICGEHTELSMQVGTEISIAQDEQEAPTEERHAARARDLGPRLLLLPAIHQCVARVGEALQRQAATA